MKSTAIILAAGLSPRMRSFKPLLPLGDSNFINRIINTYRQAGVDEIIIITGYQANQIAMVTATSQVRLCHNSNFASTDMLDLDSVLLGLNSMDESSEVCFISEAGNPLFTAFTVQALKQAVENGASFAIPAYSNKNGYPIALGSQGKSVIYAYQGSGGLQGFLDLQITHKTRVVVPDEGILMNVNSQDDYQALLRFESASKWPSVMRCTELQSFFATPAIVIRHSQVVADLALSLAEKMQAKGYTINMQLVHSGALLHDLRKDSPDHGHKAADDLEALGYGEIAAVVRYHMNLDSAIIEPPYEKYLIFMADRLVEDDRRVTLEQRFGLQLVNPDPIIREATEKRYQQALEVREQLEKMIGEPIR